MKFNNRLIILIFLALTYTQELDPVKILEKTINRLHLEDISFLCEIKLQSLSKDPTNLSFQFHSYWSDSTNYYTYLKFKSPIDYKDTELWGHYSDSIIMKKRMPINNKITKVDNGFEGVDIVDFLNFNELFKEIKNDNLTIKQVDFNKKTVYLIRSYNDKNKKKSIDFYIDKNDFFIRKVEWKNKRGVLNKILSFKNFKELNQKQIPAKIIFEDVKKGSKTTCVLSNLNLNKLDKENINKVKVGFIND
ncbi:MAG: outer membrane lipoprotein-sorting protein [Candidatus Neomarinimicrobiota bacterium]